jgi:ElaB/YqjD/DUF883 family membrane-anchored ribosome-binding protein
VSLESRIDRVLAGLATERRQAAAREREEQVRRGAREELKEHRKTFKRIKRGKLTVAEAAAAVARDHVRKDPLHYVKSPAKPQRGLKAPRLKLLGRWGKIKVYLVNATAVRKMTRQNPNAPDFTMGTNCAVWHEVWISDELGPPRPPLELQLTLLHELAETRRMLRDGLTYDDAHNESLALEDRYRKAHGRGLAAELRRERTRWTRRGGR